MPCLGCCYWYCCQFKGVFNTHRHKYKKEEKKWHVYAALCLYLGHYLKCCNSEICVLFFLSGISEVAFLKQNPTSSERRKTGHMGVLEKSWPHKLLTRCVKIPHVSALAPKWTKWRGNTLREGYYREFIRDFMHEKASLICEKNPMTHQESAWINSISCMP